MRNWLRDHSQRMMVNSSMSRWRSVTSSVLQGSVLGPVIFNIFINDIDSAIKCALSKSVDGTKLWCVVSMPKAQDVIWRDLDRLEQCTQVTSRGSINLSARSCTGVKATSTTDTSWVMKELSTALPKET